MYPVRKSAALVAALVMSCAGMALSATPAHAVEPVVKVVQANLDGGSSADVRTQVLKMNAPIATFQEMCRSEYNKWVNTYGWRGAYTVTKQDGSASGCTDVGGSGLNKGEAVLYNPAQVSNTPTSYTKVLPNPGDPDGLGPVNGDSGRSGFALTCLGDINGIVGPELYVCTTHLYVPGASSGDTIREQQMNVAEDWLLPWADWGRRVVFAGDLNMQPGNASLDQIYNKYVEASGVRSGAEAHWTTASRKIDYVFGDKPMSDQGLSMVDNSTAGHDILRAKFWFA